MPVATAPKPQDIAFEAIEGTHKSNLLLLYDHAGNSLPDDVFCFFIAGVHIKLLQYPKFCIVDVSYMPAFVFVPDRRGVLHLDQNFGGNPIQRPLILPSTQCHSPQLPPLLSLNTSLTCAYPPTAVEFTEVVKVHHL